MTDIKEFFESYILPLHQKVKAGEVNYLVDGFRTNEDSYFAAPQHAQYHYLSTIPTDNEDELVAYLQNFWKGNPELQNLAPELVELAFSLKEEAREQTAELSPFLYVMF